MTNAGRNYKTKSKAVANLPNGSSTNQAVKRVYSKSKSQPKTKVDTNKKAIMTLSRQVKAMQNQRYGEIQTCVDSWYATDIPSQASPLCFAINDFYNNTPVYKGTLGAGVPGFALSNTFSRISYQSDMNDNYEWVARMNTDQVSSIEYKPVSTRLDFEMRFNNMNSSDYPVEVRVTLLKVKPISLEGSADCTLPSRLGAYRNLCSEATDIRTNYFTPRLHEVIYDKKVKIPTDNDRVKRQVSFSIPYTFKQNHVLKPDFTTLPAGQVFITAVPQNEIIWCLISANDQAFNKFEGNGLKIRRLLKWRDRDGIQG